MKALIIGSGNLAWHFSKNLINAGIEIPLLMSRSPNPKDFPFLHQTEFVNNFITNSNFRPDYIFLLVNDDVISSLAGMIAAQESLRDAIVIHSSGAGNLNLLSELNNYGIMYPLQSLKKGLEIDFKKNVPLFIEANNNFSLAGIKELANKISDSVTEMDSEQRLKMHVAAVFVNNFVNHLLTNSELISGEHFKLLMPLLRETINRISKESPALLQTGPAVRGDQKTIQKHLEYLSKQHPKLVDEYEFLTKILMRG